MKALVHIAIAIVIYPVANLDTCPLPGARAPFAVLASLGSHGACAEVHAANSVLTRGAPLVAVEAAASHSGKDALAKECE